mgnify:CR=1 FL=1
MINEWKDRDGFFDNGEKLKIFVAPANSGGCAYFRAISPYQKLAELYPNVVEVRMDTNPLGVDPEKQQFKDDWDFEDMKWADIIVTNNICNFGGEYTLSILTKARQLGKFLHYDTDDLLTELYSGHRLEGVYKDKGLGEITKMMYNNADLVTVTQQKFADRIKPYIGRAMAIIKNAIDYNLPAWNMPKVDPPRKGVVRVGWVGGIHHEEDVKEFAGIPHLVNQKVGREKVHWGFYGRPPVDPKKGPDWQQDVWDNYQKIMMRGFKGAKNWDIYQAMPADRYGAMYTNIDIAIAPLQMNMFNDCFGKGQKILMYDGTLKKVEDVVVGDLLMGPDSTSREVLRLSSGKAKLFEINPTRGKPFTVTENHILRLKTNDSATLKYKPQFMEVTVKDYLNLNKSTKYNYRLYKTGVTFPEQKKSLILDPYYVGIMLGDGSLKNRVAITTMDEEIEEYFCEYSLSIGGGLHINKDAKKNNKASSYYASQKVGSKTQNPISEKFEQIGLLSLIHISEPTRPY